jgi:phosphoserine aminotransferase
LAASNTDRAALNFYAGPTALPSPVIARLREDILDFHDTGMGVMEISHRAPEIEGLIAETAARVRRLLGLSAEFEVLFLQGGGSLQFAMIPMYQRLGAEVLGQASLDGEDRFFLRWPLRDLAS